MFWASKCQKSQEYVWMSKVTVKVPVHSFTISLGIIPIPIVKTHDHNLVIFYNSEKFKKNSTSDPTTSLPIGSMGLVYFLTFVVDFYGKSRKILPFPQIFSSQALSGPMHVRPLEGFSDVIRRNEDHPSKKRKYTSQLHVISPILSWQGVWPPLPFPGAIIQLYRLYLSEEYDSIWRSHFFP